MDSVLSALKPFSLQASSPIMASRARRDSLGRERRRPAVAWLFPTTLNGVLTRGLQNLSAKSAQAPSSMCVNDLL